MTKTSRLSPSAVIFTAYQDAFRNITNSIVRIRSISNPEGELRTQRTRLVLEKIARRMTRERARVDGHFREAQRRQLYNKSQPGKSEPEDLVLDEILGGASILEDRAVGPDEGSRSVRASNVSFILVDDESSVRTRIFPRSFHCKACGHFVGVNPAQPPASLLCPCCHEGRLVQEPIIFACARCANVRELAPMGEHINDKLRRSRYLDAFLGGAPDCPECGDGHIHLDKHNTNSIQQWEWRCANCNLYRETVQYRCLECYLPRVEDETLPASMIFMNAFPAAAPNAFRPLLDVQMFIRDAPLDPGSLLATARETSEHWADYFEMQRGVNSALTHEEVERIGNSCIANAYLLDRVGVVTTVYGYRAGGIASHPLTPVGEDDRFARFFKDQSAFTEYVCYGMINEGAALVLELDTEMVIRRLSEIDASIGVLSYEEAIERERQILAHTPLRDVLRSTGSSDQMLLFRSLHGLEHALLSSAIQCIGNEVLGSILFLEAGVLLIYEREPIGRGGVVQVVNRGPGLLTMLEAAGDHVIGCAQGCADGCPACMYVRDAHCNYNLEELGRSWLPTNTLLSRIGARKLLVPDLPL